MPALRSDPDKSGIWEIRIAPFLKQYSVALAAIAMLIASARIVSTYSALTVVDDDHHTMEMYGPDPATGKQFKTMEIKFTRKK